MSCSLRHWGEGLGMRTRSKAKGVRRIMTEFRSAIGAFFLVALTAHSAESVVAVKLDDGTPLSYLLTTQSSTPRYTLLAMPGGSGIFNARVENGEIRFSFAGNFVVRTRNLIVDDDFAMAISKRSCCDEVAHNVAVARGVMKADCDSLSDITI